MSGDLENVNPRLYVPLEGRQETDADWDQVSSLCNIDF